MMLRFLTCLFVLGKVKTAFGEASGMRQSAITVDAAGHVQPIRGDALKPDELPSESSSASYRVSILENLAAPSEAGTSPDLTAKLKKMGIHPLSSWDWANATIPNVIICSVALVFAGILCSAGGIGGGGIYVSLLMVAGANSVQDAVPLSKAIVFLGAMPTFYLNRKMGGLIDYAICRVVVPAALIGTLVGVLLNWVLAGDVLRTLLLVILVGMLFSTVTKASSQYRHAGEATEIRAGNGAGQSSDGNADGGGPTAPPRTSKSSLASAKLLDAKEPNIYSASVQDNRLLFVDVVAGLSMLFLIVVCSVVRNHASRCGVLSIHKEACMPTAKRAFSLFSLDRVIATEGGEHSLMCIMGIVPVVYCLVVLLRNSRIAVNEFGWSVGRVCLYSSMGAVTGCLAGLIGIGGGLIFAPFLLWQDITPSVAVATSSTCVLFTSSSTTLQYLFTDRIIMPLAIVYGIVNFLASYFGTKLVHSLKSRLGAQEWIIMVIVAVGVGISAALAFFKVIYPQEEITEFA